MALSPSLLFLMPVAPGVQSFATTAFTHDAGEGGLTLPCDELLALAGAGGQTGVLIELLAFLQAPASATAEVQLRVQRADVSEVAIPATTIKATTATGAVVRYTLQRSGRVDITAFLRTQSVLVLRLVGRSTTGTAQAAGPTIAFHRDNRPT